MIVEMKLNGIYDYCGSMLNGILELKVNKKIKITLQTRQGEVIIY